MQFEEFCGIFHTIMTQNGFSEYADALHAKRFYELTVRMLETNEKMNLTAIKEESAIILLHYADSLTAARFCPKTPALRTLVAAQAFPACRWPFAALI